MQRLTAFLLAGSALLGLGGASLVTAQEQPQEQGRTGQSSTNAFGLPDEVALLRANDPNLRVANAKVNGEIITGTDVDQRVALVVAASQTQVQPDELARLRQQVLRNLIDETLQIQAARRQELPVTRERIEQTYNRVAVQNFGQNPAAMDEYLRSIGSSPNSLKRQIEGELAWQAIVGRNVSPFVNVSAEEVNDVLQRLEAARGTEEYRLGEIYLAATPENAVQVQQQLRQIMEQLRQGGSFVAYARQYSQASTAVVGGDLGFVRLPQLPAALADAARAMQPGQLAGPIAVPGGYSVLYLIDKRQVLTADPRDAVLALKQISITFQPGMTQQQAQGRVQAFAEGVQRIRGCGDAEQAAAALGATVVSNDEVRARDLPEQLQPVLLGMQIGQVTPPFGNLEDGVRVLMLCGRDDPETGSTPDFNAVMARLEEDRINKRAQRYLRDLRNDAFIEYN
ncbi:peptidylprolyl isomerase [Erythrobacteraceae bacterium CFH 75059]|uniref:peptidylprolyl isomerase n=1 Tax=Qipengyuania thermophila TaxID=2509361 RepID=UPI001022208F|nr:peptidylprolyl isomerase [Qipengyuania thermophila]TCD06341.1 peptidylprolyl isomerase [Erythrobacteraceae bacterium CFH 75059]